MQNGEYGGRVLRRFKGNGLDYVEGGIITPEIAQSWPVTNRMALFREGKVEWFGPPKEDEQKVREEGAENVKASKKSTPSVSRPRRTK